jgi:hypothetical protein
MPQTRQYASNAERQAAYRNRQSRQSATPAQNTAGGPDERPPGRVRWRLLSRQAEKALSIIQSEMQTYYDSRSEHWQESDRAEEFAERLEALTDIQEQIREWIEA